LQNFPRREFGPSRRNRISSPVIRLDPNKGGSNVIGGGYGNRGKVYQKQGDNERAIIDWTEGLRLNPEYVDAYYNRGVANNDRGTMAAPLPTGPKPFGSIPARAVQA